MQLKRLLHQHGMCLVAGHMGLHLHHGRGKGKEERPQSCRVHISEPQPLLQRARLHLKCADLS